MTNVKRTMKVNRYGLATAALLVTAAALAQLADPLQLAVGQAVITNSEVSARSYAHRASVVAVDMARSGLMPRVDLAAAAVCEHDRFSKRLQEESQTLGRRQCGLSLSHLLWHSLGTSDDVTRFGHDRLTRHLELLRVRGTKVVR